MDISRLTFYNLDESFNLDFSYILMAYLSIVGLIEANRTYAKAPRPKI
jgi:hypothetical protein